MPKSKNPNTEVVASTSRDRRQRRRFSPEYKERILDEADRCQGRGQLGEMLRREGLYSSHLSTWRAQRKEHGTAGLAAKKPGRKPKKDAKDKLIEKLQREKTALEKETRIQKGLIDLQRKAHEILGVALPRVEDNAIDDLPGSSNSARRRSR